MKKLLTAFLTMVSPVHPLLSNVGCWDGPPFYHGYLPKEIQTGGFRVLKKIV